MRKLERDKHLSVALPSKIRRAHWRSDLILKEMEDVFLIKNGKEHQGHVLGSEKEYFWLMVSDLKEVYLGHPDRVFELSGTKFFVHYDRCHKVDEMFDESGVFRSDLFSYSDKPDKMIGLLNAHKLIGAAY